MSIVRYDPFRDLRTLQEEVNRLFTGSMPRRFDDEGIARGAWSPSVDIYENKDGIVLEAELPGMKREISNLSVENNASRCAASVSSRRRTNQTIIIASREPMAVSALVHSAEHGQS
jgi:HSP20 family molecular chaperone IbpA